MRKAIGIVVASLLTLFQFGHPVQAHSSRSAQEGEKPVDRITYKNPVWPEYFADPAAYRFGSAYYAYGTGPALNGMQFPVLKSTDMVHWELVGGALKPLSEPGMDSYWAPEAAENNGKYYLYYSAGGAAGEHHRLRVAVADKPEGPFVDSGKVLMPDEPFSIDAHPFRDPQSGKWYLFFARDFFDGRAGTGVAMVQLGDDMQSVVGPVTTVVRASADWQIFERNRHWYGKTWDAWHTVEGPYVVYHDGKYYCLYSGGRWETPNYGLGYAVSDKVTGPYLDKDDAEGPSVLRGTDKMLGPGHNSVVAGPDGKTLFVVYHAWDPGHTARRMCIDPLLFRNGKPVCDGPSDTQKTVTLQQPVAVPAEH